MSDANLNLHCPRTCPICGANLARDGYPIRHQDADSGELCCFTWDVDAALAAELRGELIADSPTKQELWDIAAEIRTAGYDVIPVDEWESAFEITDAAGHIIARLYLDDSDHIAIDDLDGYTFTELPDPDYLPLTYAALSRIPA